MDKYTEEKYSKNESAALCPKCGHELGDDEVDRDYEGGDFTKYDCPNCEEVTYDESYGSRAQRVSAGEVEPEEVFPWMRIDHRNEDEKREAIEAEEEPLECDFSDTIEEGVCANPICEHEGDLKMTVYGTKLCQEHYNRISKESKLE
ncbi:hypothetical protein [Haloarcula nitratireducens]|nr:hypothetical protein [Halomicroarcula nitratireducens]